MHRVVRRGIFVFVLLLASCGRNDSYLYYLRDQKPQFYDGVHALKQLKGQRKVDILFVIDNSGSMGLHQDNLIKNADVFINEFAAKGGLEWKIGILSTDLRQQPFIGFSNTKTLTYQTPDAVKVFQAAVKRLSINGDATERTFAPIEKALDDFPDFLRPEATLALIFLTDAPEQSGITAADFLKFVRGKKGDPKKVVAYGAFAALDFKCQTQEGLNYAKSPYEEVIDATKGKVYPLCNNFGTNLADLGRDLVTRVESPYIALPDRPQTETIRVTFHGKDLPGGALAEGGYWIYNFDLNRIVFHNLKFAPGDNEEVEVFYEAQPKGN